MAHGRVSDPVDAVLSAVADPTRRTIVSRLSEGATPTATELARDLPMSRQAIAKHLQILSNAGVIAGERQGRETRYVLREDGLRLAASWLEETATTWEDRLRRLRSAAESDTGA